MKELLFVILGILLIGCQDVIRPEKPENLIPKDKMVKVLAESYTGNAARSVRNRVLRDAGVALDSILYAKYDIDSASFAASNEYYASQINDYIEMMSQVEELLNAQKKNLDTLVEKQGKAERENLKGTEKAGQQKNDSILEKGLIAPAKE